MPDLADIPIRDDHDLLILMHQQLKQVIEQQQAMQLDIKTQKELNDERFAKIESLITLARNGLAILVLLGGIAQFGIYMYEKVITHFTIRP